MDDLEISANNYVVAYEYFKAVRECMDVFDRDGEGVDVPEGCRDMHEKLKVAMIDAASHANIVMIKAKDRFANSVK